MDGCTPLSQAAANGYETVVKLLLEHNSVNANAEDFWGWTPLSLATKHGHEGVAKLLLEHDSVHAHTKDESGWTPSAMQKNLNNTSMLI